MVQTLLTRGTYANMYNKCSSITYHMAVKFGLSHPNSANKQTEKLLSLGAKKEKVTKLLAMNRLSLWFCTWLQNLCWTTHHGALPCQIGVVFKLICTQAGGQSSGPRAEWGYDTGENGMRHIKHTLNVEKYVTVDQQSIKWIFKKIYINKYWWKGPCHFNRSVSLKRKEASLILDKESTYC